MNKPKIKMDEQSRLNPSTRHVSPTQDGSVEFRYETCQGNTRQNTAFPRDPGPPIPPQFLDGGDAIRSNATGTLPR